MAATVRDQSAVVAEMAKPWPMVDALVGGTGAMRTAGKAFLPKFPAEDDQSYKDRLACATLFPAFSRTAEVLAAKPMSKAIDLDGFPAELEPLLESIDGEGSTLHAYASTLLLACLQYGLVGVLVDCPPAPDVRTKADEDAAGIRPYLNTYAAKSILGWRQDGEYLTQLRLLENVTEPDGDFGEKQIEQVRVLTPGAWQIWRLVKGADGREVWMVHDEGVTSLDVIPFVWFYGVRQGFGIGKPPLLDLAYLNVEHWQSASDQQTILHTARVPILFFKGLEETDQVSVGASAFIRATSKEADGKYIEHSGAAIDAGRQSILDIEERMRMTGAELLVQYSVSVTATQSIGESEASKSILQRICENFEESLEEAIELMGRWVGLNFDAEVELFKDFGAKSLSDQSTVALIQAESAGIVSKQTVFESLKRRDLIPQETTWEDESKRISAAQALDQNAAQPPTKIPPRENGDDGAVTGSDQQAE